jgi:hypothetical protein
MNDTSDAFQSDGDLKAAVAKALRQIIAPGARYPFSRGLIQVSIARVDAARGEANLHIGACRFVEGSQLASLLEGELKARIPGLKGVSVGMTEI